MFIRHNQTQDKISSADLINIQHALIILDC